jgi:hypothetical protein
MAENVYLVTVVLAPTKKQEKDGEGAKILVAATTVIAKDEQALIMKATMLAKTRHNPQDHRTELPVDRLEVRFIPFRQPA